MNIKVRDQLLKRQRRVDRRLGKRRGCGARVLGNGHARFEVSDRIRGTAAGGVRLAHELANAVRLPQEIDSHVDLLRFHLPYHESDHVLAMAFNLLAGGSCIEDLEHRRNDETFPDMLGADRLPDPTTAGDLSAANTSPPEEDNTQTMNRPKIEETTKVGGWSRVRCGTGDSARHPRLFKDESACRNTLPDS